MAWDFEIKSGDTIPWTFDLSDATGDLDLTQGWAVRCTIVDAITRQVIVDDEPLAVDDADSVTYDPNTNGVLEVLEDGRPRDLLAEFDLTNEDDVTQTSRAPTHGYFVIHVNPNVDDLAVTEEP